jgi:hypothetical protein
MAGRTLKIDPLKAAEIIATAVMTPARGSLAERIALVDSHGRDMGGWGYGPLRDQIERILYRQFNKGDHVYSTEAAEAAGVFDGMRQGVVATNSRDHGMVSVRVRGKKAATKYAVRFWQRYVD